MAPITRRAFITICAGTVLTGFNPKPANAQLPITILVIKFCKWSWPYLQEALIKELAAQAAKYIIKYTKKLVKVTIEKYQDTQGIEVALKNATDSHLIEMLVAAGTAGVRVGRFFPNLGGISPTPAAIAAAQATLSPSLVANHDEVSSFLAAQAYQVVGW